MNVFIHKEMDVLEKIAPAWIKLKNEFHNITVFQDKNWIRSWWEYQSNQANITPYIIEIKDGEATIGIIPLYIQLITLAKFKFNMLKPIGSGDSDYFLPLFSRNYAPNILLNLALEKLQADKSNWDCMEWGDIPEKSWFAKCLDDEFAGKSIQLIRDRNDICPFLILNGDMEETKKKISKQLLKRVRYNERRLNREGDLKFTKVTSKDQIEPIMNRFFELHCGRWENTNTPSKFRHKYERDYAMSAAKSLFESNLLQLTFLSLNNNIIAIDFGMSDGKRMYLYLCSMNMEYKTYAPTHLLTYYQIIEGHKDGIEIVDFLRGDEEYKQRWGTQATYNLKYCFFNRTTKSLLCKNLIHTLQTLEPLRSNFKNKLISVSSNNV